MNTADTTENTEKKTSALPAKKVSDSETHQLLLCAQNAKFFRIKYKNHF